MPRVAQPKVFVVTIDHKDNTRTALLFRTEEKARERADTEAQNSKTVEKVRVITGTVSYVPGVGERFDD